MVILLNTAELRLGAATVLAHMRLDIATTKLKQRALAAKLEVYETIITKHGLSSVRPVGTYELRLRSVLLTAHPFFQLSLNLMPGIPWNYRI